MYYVVSNNLIAELIEITSESTYHLFLYLKYPKSEGIKKYS